MIPYKNGKMDLDALQGMLNDDVSGVYIENPNMFGLFEEAALKIKEMLSPKQLFVVGVNPMTLGIVKAPGDYGADIVVGDAQPLGLPMAFGGPSVGIFATTMKFVRKMPGRIIGATKDEVGRRAFAMTLSTREQHIRRERATSNICTNEALTSIMAAAYLATLGKNGFSSLGKQLISRGRYLSGLVNDLEGFTAPAYEGHFFNEFPVMVDVDVCHFLNACEDKGILAGINVSAEMEGEENIFTIATTEMHTHQDYEKLMDVLKEAREVVN
jgi:glycine dehydrogenase subunit 1